MPDTNLIRSLGRKSTALFTTYTLVAVTKRIFILFCIFYPSVCYYAIVALLSRKSQEIARTMLLSCASQHALSHTCYPVETGANFLESFSPFRNSEQTSRSCETNPLGETHFISLYVSILALTAGWKFYVVPALVLGSSGFCVRVFFCC